MMRAERFDSAEAALRGALAERKGDGQIAFLLGVAIQKQKRYADAKPYFEQALASKQSFPEVDYVFHFLGWCAYYLGDLALARDAFDEHLRRVPNEADSVFGLGVVALDDDRLDDAESAFTRAIAMQEKDPKAARDVAKAKARLGDVLVRREKLADAERVLRDAVTLYPDHYEAWAKLARVLDRLERPDEAAKARDEEKAAMARVGRT